MSVTGPTSPVPPIHLVLLLPHVLIARPDDLDRLADGAGYEGGLQNEVHEQPAPESAAEQRAVAIYRERNLSHQFASFVNLLRTSAAFVPPLSDLLDELYSLQLG
jgi:hypothetical protein